jgi:hypothetical protein
LTKQFLGNDSVDQEALMAFRLLAMEIRDSLITLDEANDVFGVDMFEKSRFGSALTIGEEMVTLNTLGETLKVGRNDGWLFYNPDTMWSEGANNVW